MLSIKNKDIEEINFPDGQVHYRIFPFNFKGEDVEYTISIQTPKDLYKLQVISEICKQRGYNLKHLIIPYLMGGRYDRPMSEGDINPLKIIINTINNLNIEEITLFEPHSDVSIALFNGKVNVAHFDFENIIINSKLYKYNIAIVFPDAGAHKRYSKYFKGDYTFLTANKVRDLKTGNLKLEVSNPELVKDKKVFVVDDLCDGGATFIELAKQLNIHRNDLVLLVAHGIFSRGVDKLFKYYSEIYTTNSYFNRDLKVDIKDSKFTVNYLFDLK